MSELKPCPFCGGEANIHHDYSSESGDWYVVDCLNKKCSMLHSRGAWDSVNVTTGWRPTEAEAIESWNTRHERTCRNVQEGEHFGCSECGMGIDLYNDYGGFYNYTDGDWNFCPNCGAKVVGE